VVEHVPAPLWGHACRYPVDQVPLHTCLSPRQGIRTATYTTTSDHASYSGGFRRCHLSNGSGSYLPTREGSDTVTCPAAPDPTFLLRRAPALPHVLRLRILPFYSGGLRRCHVSLDTRPLLPAQEGSDVVTCSVALCGPHTSRIKKSLVDLPIRLASHVSKTCPHVTETSDT
jgi:hypothetical protein